MRRARSGPKVPPLPLRLWQRSQCCVLNNCSPRLASPAITAAAEALQESRTTAPIARSRNITDLLSRQPEAGRKHMGAERLEEVELLSEAIVLPLAVPGQIFVQRQRQAR